MPRALHPLTNIGLNLLWRLRPARRSLNALVPDSGESQDRDTQQLCALIQRFPYWQRGRLWLAEASLRANDVATAYAEAYALRALARPASHLHAASLSVLGRCYLRRGDATAALPLLIEANRLNPDDHVILEERAAAHALLGDRNQALEILKTIPPAQLSAEGKAALRWLGEQG